MLAGKALVDPDEHQQITKAPTKRRGAELNLSRLREAYASVASGGI